MKTKLHILTKIIFIFTTILFTTCTPPKPDNSKPPIDTTAVNGLIAVLTSGNYSYQEGEPIKLSLEFKNVTNHEIILDSLYGKYLNIVGNPFEIILRDKYRNIIGRGTNLEAVGKKPFDIVIDPQKQRYSECYL